MDVFPQPAKNKNVIRIRKYLFISLSSLRYKHCNYQNIRRKNRQNSKQAENLLPENPTLLVFEPLKEEILEGIRCSFVREAIVKVLVVLVRFEPEFVGV